MDREGGQGGSALAIQISQAGWTDVIYLSAPHYDKAIRSTGWNFQLNHDALW